MTRVSPPSTLSDTTPNRLLYWNFRDIDEMAAAVPRGIDLRLTQLSLQPFRCDSMALDLEVMQFSFNRPNCGVRAIGGKEPGFLYFVCILHGIGHPVISHEMLITQDYLYGFDPNRGVDKVFPANSIHCSVSVRQDVFASLTDAMDRPDLNARFFSPNFLYVPEKLPPLRAYLTQLYALLLKRSEVLQQPDFQQLIMRDFLPLLVAALPIQQTALKSRVKTATRSHLIQQAETYLQDHLHQPLTLSDLCTALYTSSRTLSYGFQDIFDMSPMAYLKTLRLQSVHRALKQADPGEHSIQSIANQFGFWSINHFIKDYKAMFGETPSATLAKGSY